MRVETLSALRLDDAYVRIMCEVLTEYGIDSRDVLTSAGLPRRLPETGGTTSAEESIAFRRAFAAATDKRRELWTIAAGRLVLHTTHPYSQATRTARDLESVVRILQEGDLYLALMTIHPLRDEHAQLVGIEFDFSAAPPDLRTYEEVTAMTAHIRGWDSLWAGPLPYRFMELPVALNLQEIHRDRHPNVVRASGRPRLHWYPEVSKRVLPGANQYLHQQHVAALDDEIAQLRGSLSLSDRVLRRLRAPGGASTPIRDVAKALEMSSRTLQRALGEQDVTFRGLQDSVKREMAVAGLRGTTEPIARIARDLGYTSPSSFSDAFRSWFGQSPSDFRSRTAETQSPVPGVSSSGYAPRTSESAPYPAPSRDGTLRHAAGRRPRAIDRIDRKAGQPPVDRMASRR